MKKHKLNIFPVMTGEDLERLKNDLKEYGYDEAQPIYTYQDCILDGWNRYKICEELEIEPSFKEFIGEEMEALEFVMRTNKRRNLSSSQWAVIALDNEELVNKLKEEARGRMSIGGQGGQQIAQVKTSEKLASMFNTNKQYIKEVAKIKETDPEAIEKIRSGEKTITEYKKEQDTMERIKKTEEKFLKQTDDIDDREITPYGENIYYVSTKFQNFPSSYKVIEEGEHYPTLKRRSWFYHPNGREFSLREYAEVQTFPEDFKFVGTY